MLFLALYGLFGARTNQTLEPLRMLDLKSCSIDHYTIRCLPLALSIFIFEFLLKNYILILRTNILNKLSPSTGILFLMLILLTLSRSHLLEFPIC